MDFEFLSDVVLSMSVEVKMIFIIGCANISGQRRTVTWMTVIKKREFAGRFSEWQ